MVALLAFGFEAKNAATLASRQPWNIDANGYLAQIATDRPHLWNE
jgi:hypothetical protein